jgi:hypothetical protein
VHLFRSQVPGQRDSAPVPLAHHLNPTLHDLE